MICSNNPLFAVMGMMGEEFLAEAGAVEMDVDFCGL